MHDGRPRDFAVNPKDLPADTAGESEGDALIMRRSRAALRVLLCRRQVTRCAHS